MTMVLRAIIVLTIPIVLFMGSIRLLMTPAFLHFEYTRAGFPEDSYGFTVDDRLVYGNYALDYLLRAANTDYFDDLRLPPGKCYPPHKTRDCALFNPLEISHLYDVKQVVQIAFAVAILMAITSSISIFLLWRYQKIHTLQKAFFQGSLLTLCLLLTLVTLVIGAWTAFFDGFHALFFESDTWRFYYSDTLIRLYPQQFWFDASLISGIIVCLIALLIFAFSWWQGQRLSSTQS